MNPRTDSWTDDLDPGSQEVATRFIAAATELDGLAPVSEQGVLSLTEPGAAWHLLTDTGYVNLQRARGEHPAMAEVVVAPEFRGRGHGVELVSAALARGARGTRVWAHGDLPPARAVAAQLALRPVRTLLQLRRSLTEELPELVVPEGLTLRTYQGSRDDEAVLRVNNAAFGWHPEQGHWTLADIECRRAESWFDPAGLFLLFQEETVLGFHWTKTHPDGMGEVYVVAVDPAARGRGLGRVLTLAGLRHLQAQGHPGVPLYTEADNAPAVVTYDRLGFTTYRTDTAYA